MPFYQMGLNPGMPGTTSTEAVQSYQSGSHSGTVMYQPMMPPPSFPQHMDTSGRYAKTEAPHDIHSPRHQQLQAPPLPLPLPLPQNHAMGSTSPVIQSIRSSSSLSRLRPPETKSPTSATVKNLPPSLASITSPFIPDQSKNYHAQMPKLGERLRFRSQDPEGPAAHFSRRARQRPPQRRVLRTYTSILGQLAVHHRRSKCNQGLVDASATLHFFLVSSHLPETTTANI